MSSRPERPDFLVRAALWRVGPRRGGICFLLPSLRTLLLCAIFLFSFFFPFPYPATRGFTITR